MEFSSSILRKSKTQLAQSKHGDAAIYNLKVGLWETACKYEIYEMHWESGLEISEHMHYVGTETFLMVSGSADIVLAGNRFFVGAGDMVHVPKYMPHQFKFLEDSTWVTFFQEVDYFSSENTTLNCQKYFPIESSKADPQLTTSKRKLGNSCITVHDEVVEKQDYYYVRRKGQQLFCYTDSEGTYNLKVPKWETGGVCEIWEIVWKKGSKIDMHSHNFLYESFLVTGGSVEIDDGQEKYIAKVGDVVHLQPFVTHSILCLEKDTSVISIMMSKDPNSMSFLQSKIEAKLSAENSSKLPPDIKYAKNDIYPID